MVYFSSLRNRGIYDSNGKRIGILKDLVFRDGETFAEITHLIYLSKEKYRKKISWNLVREIKDQPSIIKSDLDLFLNVSVEETNPAFEQENELLVGQLLDKQIVDVDGMKVVRVNDILLGKMEGKFSIAAVCVGPKSMLRRLGVEKLTVLLKVQEQIIKWESVEPLDKDLHGIHIKYQKSKIADLHPSDIADIMEDLSPRERVLIFNSLDKAKAAETILEAEPEVQDSFFENVKFGRIIEILNTISIDQAVDVLSFMPKRKSQLLLKSMNHERAQKIKELMNYPGESAGSIMITEFISVPDTFTAQETIDYLRKVQAPTDHGHYVYVVSKEHHLMGVLSLRALIRAIPSQKVSTFMTNNIAKLKLTTPKEDIAAALTKYDILSIPVIDENNVLKGVIRADDVLEGVMPKQWKRRKVHFRKRNK